MALILALVIALACHAQAKAVFAHFMLANSQNFTLDDWKEDITLAQAAKIDAFALNTGYGGPYTGQLLNDAFAVAAELDFKLFLSLDYSGDGRWPQDQVIKWLGNYTKLPAYYKHNGEKPLVSTFEGYEAQGDWTNIKKKVDCFFMPDWSSILPEQLASSNVTDGLMSWSAWPDGTAPMNTSMDERYQSALRSTGGTDKPYIMPVSPWFYTNMVRYNKNWVWQGDDLWYKRWDQVVDIEPEYVEILTWNDFGESHYIGPIHEHDLGTFTSGGAPYDYAIGMPHDGWRAFLPYVIDRYKTGAGSATVDQEGLVTWYRLTPSWACSDGKTTGNTATQAQHTYPPGEVLKDEIFFSALLDSAANLTVSIGDEEAEIIAWSDMPAGGNGAPGLYFGSVPMDNRIGEVNVTLTRDGQALAQVLGQPISTQCGSNNLTNWNAWVGSNMTDPSANGSNSKDSGAAAWSSRSPLQQPAVLISGLIVWLGLWLVI
ncbi:glycoside hydrolase family 71 protein [Aspergillus homomorphus CBS 101889]|uniref:Glycoside hydrolase n=1 Tax=Aspergillus homomorphus (strain CBS 101889) TaxID=1450537 RepID=A0A395HKY4_ASPHC|nr:glycoside hydrolase [Aspergillus homomorphus CBS 101889]RAL07875.1 glycoside hydrolase [Aspergillus homomorphus CBS 101889]